MIGRYDAEKGVICLEMTPDEARSMWDVVGSDEVLWQAILDGMKAFREHEALAALRGPGEPYVHLSPRETDDDGSTGKTCSLCGKMLVLMTLPMTEKSAAKSFMTCPNLRHPPPVKESEK